MSEVVFVRPTLDAIKVIAADMRQADIDEVWASNRKTPMTSLLDGWKNSHYCAVAEVDNTPLVMFGLVNVGLLSDKGVIWMLGSNKSLQYRRQFLIKTPDIIEEMLNICPNLCNMVHTKNKVSIQWLRWLGFTIEKPVEYGPDKELFHKFYLRRV